MNNETPFVSATEAWLDPPPDLQPDEMMHRELSNVMCSIQVETPCINVKYKRQQIFFHSDVRSHDLISST